MILLVLLSSEGKTLPNYIKIGHDHQGLTCKSYTEVYQVAGRKTYLPIISKVLCFLSNCLLGIIIVEIVYNISLFD